MTYQSPLIYRHLLKRGSRGLYILWLLGISGLSVAQVVTHITPSGLGTVVTPNGNSYNIAGGTRAGSNLFHSLGRFSVGSSDIANFQNSEGNPLTSNILVRVTGGFQSAIDGTIRTTDFGAANLFLLNPAGVVFNSGATLDVGGSFHVSTADYVDLQDGGRFYSDPAQTSTLTSAPPSAFGFTLTNNGKINFDGAQLEVASGKSLTASTHRISRANLIMTSGILSAPGGRVELIEVASGSSVAINSNNSSPGSSSLNPLVTPQNFDPTKDIYIRSGVFKVHGASLVTSPESPGNITVEVDNIEIKNGGSLATDTTGPQNGGNISINANTLNIGGNVSTSSSLLSQGNAGNILINANRITVNNQGNISSTTDGFGNAGNISIRNASTFNLQGLVSTNTQAAGNAGQISLQNLGSVHVSHSGTISSGTTGSGNGGNINISAQSISLTDQGSGISAESKQNPFSLAAGVGDAGQINLTSQALTVRNGAAISTSTQTNGNAGSLHINANNLLLDNNGIIESTTGTIGANGQPVVGTGNAGNININTTNLTAQNGSQINAVTHGVGRGGTINISTSKLALANNSSIAANSTSSNLNLAANPSAGLSGNIAIQATRFFRLSGGSSVNVTTQQANAGSIDLQVGNLLHLIASNINTSVANGTGNGGNIIIDPNFVVLANGSSIIANAQQGAGGNIFIVADFLFSSFSPDSIISASSEQGINGTVVIRSPAVDITSSSLQLPESFLDASAILPERCAARSGKTGSFILRDRAGIPPNPDTVLPSSYHDVDVGLSPGHEANRSNYSHWLLSQDDFSIESYPATGCTPRA